MNGSTKHTALQLKRRSTPSIMSSVILALLPGTVLMVNWLGPGVLMNLIVVLLSALACEACCLRCRRRAIRPALGDGSIILAAWLLALCLPTGVPFTHLIVGSVAMCVLGKHIYGGLGQNVFNPAMVGYAIMLISFPTAMTTWVQPGELSALTAVSNWEAWWKLKWYGGSGLTHWDAITQATPLDRLRGLERQALAADINTINAPPWRALSIAWLAGGVFLLTTGIIRWHIPIAMLVAAALTHTVHALIAPAYSMPLTSSLFYGGLMFGAFFIATDPVTAPSSVSSRLVYGAGIGLLTVIIRTTSNYPEGVAFAVLLMNATSPLLDRVFVLNKRV